VEAVLKTMPASAYLDFTSMSEHALIYDERPIASRMIVLYEASGLGVDKAGEPSVLAYCVRSLLSEGRIRYTTVEKTSEGMRAKHIERLGPTGLITTTTWAGLHPENETRMLSIASRDTREQTEEVLSTLALQCDGTEQGDVDLAPWLALQTWLELAGVRDVVIPYARELASKCNSRAVRMRRDFAKVLSLVKAHAILHQTHRERQGGKIVATITDYAAVYDVACGPVSEGIEATVSPTVRETVAAVAKLLADRPTVTVMAISRELGLDKSSAWRRVNVAKWGGYLVNQEDKRGRPAQLVLGDPLPEEEPALPTPEELGGCPIDRTVDSRDLQLAQVEENKVSVLLNHARTTATVQPPGNDPAKPTKACGLCQKREFWRGNGGQWLCTTCYTPHGEYETYTILEREEPL